MGPNKHISINSFSKRVHVTEKAVRKAIASGRLELSIAYVDGRPVITDAALAEKEWRENRDASKASADPTTSQERRRLLGAQAEKVELENRQKRGELFDGRVAKQAWSAMVAAFRARSLAIPRALAETLAAASSPAAVEKILDDEIRAALSELAGWTPSPADVAATQGRAGDTTRGERYGGA